MKLTQRDKDVLLSACATEEARIARKIGAEVNQGIKELLKKDYDAVRDVAGRISNEVAV